MSNKEEIRPVASYDGRKAICVLDEVGGAERLNEIIIDINVRDLWQFRMIDAPFLPPSLDTKEIGEVLRHIRVFDIGGWNEVSF